MFSKNFYQVFFGKRWQIPITAILLGGPGFAQEPSSVQVIELDTIIFSPHYYDDLERALAEPENVWYLDLSMQKLRSLPPEIEKLTNLRYLDISFNRLTEIPAEIARLPRLEVLKISGLYNLAHLPEFLYEMKHLKELYAIDLRVPPEELERLKKALPNTKVYTRPEELPRK